MMGKLGKAAASKSPVAIDNGCQVFAGIKRFAFTQRR